MSITTFPNGISSFGIPVIGSGTAIPATTGNYYFVDSGTGLDSNEGTYGKPLATIDAAINKCTSNNGDVIVVFPGHAETISGADGIALDVAGTTIVGLGNAQLRPTLTYSATASTTSVGAANCRISGIRFVSNVDSLVKVLDVNEGNFTIDNCEFVSSSTKEMLCCIDIATTKDNFVIKNCDFTQPTDPAGTDAAAGTGCIYCVDTENILIEGCKFKGLWETAIVHNKTTKVQGLVLKDCLIMHDGPSTSVPLELVAASTGMMSNCNGYTLLADDVTEAKLFGATGINFWINNTHFGNDSGGGGQQGVGGTACT